MLPSSPRSSCAREVAGGRWTKPKSFTMLSTACLARAGAAQDEHDRGCADPEEGAEPSAPAGAASSPSAHSATAVGGTPRRWRTRRPRRARSPAAAAGWDRGLRRVTLGDHEGRADLVGARGGVESTLGCPGRAGHLAHHLTVEHLTSWGSIGCLGEWRSGPRFCFDWFDSARLNRTFAATFKHFRPPRAALRDDLGRLAHLGGRRRGTVEYSDA